MKAVALLSSLVFAAAGITGGVAQAKSPGYTPYSTTPTYGTGSNSRSTKVAPSTRSDGTYVPAHTRSNPNSTQTDNWSTKGNYNPNTGKAGTKDAYR